MRAALECAAFAAVAIAGTVLFGLAALEAPNDDAAGLFMAGTALLGSVAFALTAGAIALASRRR